MKTRGLWLLSLLAVVACTPTVQVSRNQKTRLSAHRLVAVLPFEVTLSGNRGPVRDYPSMKDKLQEKGVQIQEAVHSFLHSQLKDSVRLLSSDETNRLLQEHRITPEKLFWTPKPEVARMLGVDGVVFGRAELRYSSKRISPAAATVAFLSTGFFVVGSLSTAETDFRIDIAEKENLEPVWSCRTLVRRQASINSVVRRRVGRKIPYVKKP